MIIIIEPEDILMAEKEVERVAAIFDAFGANKPTDREMITVALKTKMIEGIAESFELPQLAIRQK